MLDVSVVQCLAFLKPITYRQIKICQQQRQLRCLDFKPSVEYFYPQAEVNTAMNAELGKMGRNQMQTFVQK